MIRWSPQTIIDGLPGVKEETVKKAVENPKKFPPYYVVTLSYNPNNLLDIWKVKELHKPFYQDKDLVIVGVSHTREGAKDIAFRILEKSYLETGEFDLRGAYDPPGGKEAAS